MLILLQVFLFVLVFTHVRSQSCTNFSAKYDGIHLSLTGLNNGGKVRISITHNEGVSYTNITPSLAVGQDAVTIIPIEPVEYVLMEALDGTMNTVCSQKIQVNPTKTNASIPIVDIMSSLGKTRLITDKGTLQMTANVLPASLSDRTVTWSLAFGTGKASIDKNGLLTACSNGTVTVTATSNLNPSISSSMVITFNGQTSTCNLVGVEEVSDLVSVRPNPVTEKLFIEGTELIKNISIFNAEGVFIKNVSVDNTSAEINVSDFSKGLYLLKVERNDGVGIRKFMKN
jgi:Secretion system C-terminal sorting domain/Bacterial Ig-like domain (group 2)